MALGFLTVLTLLLGATTARADFYSYVDASGVLHISNVPVSNKYLWMMPENERGGGSNKVISSANASVSYDTLIYNVSRRYGVDPNLVKAVVRAESDYNPSAISRAGARGLMQLMPETARLMGVKNIHDPVDNVNGGTRHLSRLIKKFNGKLPMALAAYNAGEGAVKRYGRIPPYKETQRYVKKVLKFYDFYSGVGR
ncbi:MAG: transglycosylase SLT domain-containing protein [Proteobacteria bacterium]|nr:transglycosylase SLT domain-containing protein [Pseudomonadota bacterium]